MIEFEGRLMGGVRKFKQALEDHYSKLEEERKSLLNKLSEIPTFTVKETVDANVSENSKWFLQELNSKRVVGVDGSQIKPLKDIGVPLGGIQIAKLSIEHGDGHHDLTHRSAFIDMDENVSLARFKMEVEALVEEMDGMSLLFFDGSLSTSFTAEMSEKLRQEYAVWIGSLLQKSEETRTPLVGYVDRSYAKDLAKSMGVNAYDPYLLSPVLNLMDYTSAFKSEKDGLCYSYLRANPHQPVRLEYPPWMEDMHHDVVRSVMAECMLGSTRGYPYVLERAHTCCQIERSERMDFMKAFSRDTSFKWMSKQVRGRQ